MARLQRDMVKVHGLKELVRGLNGAPPEVWRALRAEFKGVGDWMAGKAAANARSGHPAAAKTLAPTFKGKGDRYGVIVRLGGRGGEGGAHRGGAGWEYGSRDPSDQFYNRYIHVGSDGAMEGHYLGQAIKSNRRELEEKSIDAVHLFWGRLADDVNRSH